MKVKALDAHLINVIAAGEVIDRPASIVKELVENSLDALAKRVKVEVEAGGTALIRVIDDGQGIASEDLKLAIQRHTTSKIATQQDLETIQTLGFRGEALASICEVARVQISSRTRQEKEAHCLVVEGGKVQSLRATGRGVGTTIEVRDLFFNLPPRRKFLKSEKTETLHITRVMKRFLFSHPHVHLELRQGTRSVLDSPGSQTLQEIASHLYGAKLAKSLVPVEFDGELVKVRGWVSAPQLTRADRNEQYVFVNRRAVSDALIQHTLNRAFEGVLDKQRHPYACLKLTLDPHLVDVNVHPQKHEVRFLDPQSIKRDLMQALNQALVSSHATPKLPWKAAQAALRYRPHPQRQDLDLEAALKERRTFPDAADTPQKQRQDLPPRTPPLQKQPRMSPTPPATGGLIHTCEERVVGQLHGTYIVVQTPEGFELIDQHVAHERILYEQFLKQFARGGVLSQKLLLPETLKTTPDQAQLLSANLRALADLGIEAEAFGTNAFLLRGWPQALAAFHAATGYQHPLERLLALLESEEDPDIDVLAKALVASLACEAAVVKNTLMPLEAMRHLVAQLKTVDDPYHCPHGRPIVLKYELSDLERAFKRR